jgi:hypothetical protein
MYERRAWIDAYAFSSRKAILGKRLLFSTRKSIYAQRHPFRPRENQTCPYWCGVCDPVPKLRCGNRNVATLLPETEESFLVTLRCAFYLKLAEDKDRHLVRKLTYGNHGVSLLLQHYEALFESVDFFLYVSMACVV